MMLEVACRVGINGAEPLRIQEAGAFEKGLLEGQYAYEKLTVDAALESGGDTWKWVQQPFPWETEGGCR